MKYTMPALLLTASLASACGGGTPANDAATDVNGRDVQTATDSGGGNDVQPGTDTVVVDAATGADTGTMVHSASIPTGACFSFATGMFDMSNPCNRELYTLAGANVDLSSGSGMTLCDLPGPYANLAAVPTSYASCNFTSYIEGIVGLANHGMIVRDTTSTHHYRVWIQSNTNPSLMIQWDTID